MTDEPNDDLNPRQRRFVEEYLKDMNGSRAAKAAGSKARDTSVAGSTMLASKKVAAAVAEAMAERSRKTGINAEWVLTRLAAEADADIADLYDDAGALRPVRDWPKIWRPGLVTGVDIDEINVNGSKVGEIKKIRLSDRLRRLELIG